MKVDISFTNAKVYDILDKVDIVKGEDFILHTDSTTPLEFFANNDPVLTLIQDESDIKGTAESVGSSTIIIMDANLNRLKILHINVVETVEMTSTLGLTVGNPEPK